MNKKPDEKPNIIVQEFLLILDDKKKIILNKRDK
jgi:hypothetical protein